MCKITLFLWNQLWGQAELTLNLMLQAMADPSKSAWEYLDGRPFNYYATPLGPLGIPVIIHSKPSQCKSWYYRGRNGFSAGFALNHYRCQRALDTETKVVYITDTVEFCHQYLTQPGLTPTDRLIHALHKRTSTMHHAPEVNSEHQLQAIYHLRRLFSTWRDTKTATSAEPNDIPKLTHSDFNRLPQDLPVEKPSNQ